MQLPKREPHERIIDTVHHFFCPDNNISAQCTSHIQTDINLTTQRITRIHGWKWFLTSCSSMYASQTVQNLLCYACKTMCCIYFYYTHGCADVSLRYASPALASHHHRNQINVEKHKKKERTNDNNKMFDGESQVICISNRMR